MLKQTRFDISQEKRQLVCRCHNIPDRKGDNQRVGRLCYSIAINKSVIIKETVNEGLMVLISKGY